VFNVVGAGTGLATIGSGSVVTNGPSGVGALNFVAAAGSNFNNAGGFINMQPSLGGNNPAANPHNAVTLNVANGGLGGTSDLNYTYAFTGKSYNFNGGFQDGAFSRLGVNTFLGGPGSKAPARAYSCST
jgi:hypothetical protein